MAQLVDHHGNPINTGQLTAREAVAQPWGVRKAHSQYTLSGLDPARLARILRDAEHGDATAYLELAEEMEEKYLHYAAQLATRKRAIKGLEWDNDPASEKLQARKIAEFVGHLVPVIKRATFDLADSIGKGYAVAEILYDTSGPQWKIKALEWCDPRWFQFDKIDGRTLRMRSDTNPDGEPLTPGKYFVVRIAAKSGLPIRGGLARAAAWAWMCVNFSVRDWLTFAEEFGKPLRLGRYEAGVSSPADLDILYDAVSSLGTDAAAMLPKSMEIEFPEVQGARGEAGLWSNLIDHFDRKISMLVIGQTLTADTGKGGGGSYALGAVHNDVRRDILVADAEAIAEAVNEQLVPLIVNLNFAGVTEYPTLSLPVPSPEDLVAFAGIVERAVGIGQPVGQKWFSEKFSIPLPDAGEAVLGKPATPPVDAAQQAAQRAAHARAAVNQDTADKMTPALAAANQAVIDRWIEQIDGMLAEAESLEQFSADLLTRYSELQADDMVTLMSLALQAITLRGQAEVRGGQ